MKMNLKDIEKIIATPPRGFFVRNPVVIEYLTNEQARDFPKRAKHNGWREFKEEGMGVSGMCVEPTLMHRSAEGAGECRILMVALKSRMDAVATGLYVTDRIANSPALPLLQSGRWALGDFAFGHHYPDPGTLVAVRFVRGNVAVAVGGGRRFARGPFVDALEVGRRIDAYFAAPPRVVNRGNGEPARIEISLVKAPAEGEAPPEAEPAGAGGGGYATGTPYQVRLAYAEPPETPTELRLYVDHGEIWEDDRGQIRVTPMAAGKLKLEAYVLDEAGYCIAKGEQEMNVVSPSTKPTATQPSDRKAKGK